MILYIDDFKVYCPYNATTEWFKTEFAKVYKIKDLGVASNYLGMEIEQTDGMIKVTQKWYIKYMLDKFGMTNCKAAKTPMEERIQLTKAPKDYVADLTDLKLYQQLEGTLMHLSIQTRPDITYAVNKLGQFLSNPTPTHWNVLKRVLKYVKGTPEVGITYRGPEATLELLSWTDSSWGDNLDDA